MVHCSLNSSQDPDEAVPQHEEEETAVGCISLCYIALCCGMSAELVVRNRWRNLIALRRMLRWLWGGETQKGDHVATIEVESTLTSASSAEPILVSCLY